MADRCFADALGERVDLTSAERDALIRLEERTRDARRGTTLQRSHGQNGELYILRRGVMMNYVLLADGSRQILRFLFPGDLIGVLGVIYSEPPETLCALTDCVICPFDQASLGTLFVDHPRLAALILVLSQIERAGLADRLAGLGRTGAKARVAALLLDWWHRLRASDRTVEASFPLPLTQEEIGDATGLTAVHVNRMLRQLADDKLIARDNGWVTITNERELVRAANYVNRSEGLALGWLPKGR